MSITQGVHLGLAMPACTLRTILQRGMRPGGSRGHTKPPRGGPVGLGDHNLGDSPMEHIIEIQCGGEGGMV